MNETHTLSGQALDDRIRFLLTGDDGAVGDSEERSIKATRCHLGGLPSLETELFQNWTHDHETEYPFIEWVWQTRHSKPHQSALESHVASYREPARAMGVLELIEALRVKGLFVWFEPIDGSGRITVPVGYEYEVCRWDTTFDTSRIANLTVTIKLAAVAALESTLK